MQTETVFSFPDTHRALAGEKALADAGLPVRVMPRPSALGQGCGICLRVDERNRAAAEEALLRKDIEIDAIYSRSHSASGTLYRRL